MSVFNKPAGNSGLVSFGSDSFINDTRHLKAVVISAAEVATHMLRIDDDDDTVSLYIPVNRSTSENPINKYPYTNHIQG